MKTQALIATFACFLAACAAAGPNNTTYPNTPNNWILEGRVLWLDHDDKYQVNATQFNDLAKAATVALIDPLTGRIAANTITEANGAFRMQNLTGVATDTTYILEAVKDLATASVGADVARVRTLIKGEPGAWTHIAAGQLVVVNASTTALCILQSLRRTNANDLLGTLTLGTPDVFNPGTSTIDPAEFNSCVNYVNVALSRDADPVEGIKLLGGGNLQLRADLVNEVSITYCPGIGNPGDVFNIYGVGFTSLPNVTFPSGAQANIPSYNRAVIHATIPNNPGSGEITVTVGNASARAPFALKQPLSGNFNLP